jgi:hypothetical protein
MTDIETRLRGLAAPSLSEQPTPASIRARAKRRTARRRKGLAIVLIVAMGGAVLGIAQLGDGPEHLTAGPGTTTPPPLTEPGPEQGTIGEVAGVTVSVTPHGDLVDGELVEITVEGLENLPGAADSEMKVRAGLLMAEIAKLKEVRVTEADIEKGYEELAEQTGKNVAKVKAEYRDAKKREMLIGMILEDKILDLVEGAAKITDA